MGFKCGIVGLPMSQVDAFNALTAAAAQRRIIRSAPSSQCRRGRVPDPLLDTLRDCQIRSDHSTAADLRRYRGPVRGASKVDGLGNRVSRHHPRRGSDAIAHVVRCFEIRQSPMSRQDRAFGRASNHETELMLPTSDSLEKRVET